VRVLGHFTITVISPTSAFNYLLHHISVHPRTKFQQNLKSYIKWG